MGIPAADALRWREGKIDMQGRTLSENTFRPKTSPVPLHDLSGDIKTESHPARIAHCQVSHPDERREYLIKLIRGYTRTLVEDGYHRKVFCSGEIYANLRTVERILDGVAEKIAEHFTQSAIVSHHDQ